MVSSKRARDDIGTADIFRILVATDLHVGYGERDPVRAHDSFKTFEEVLILAQQQRADFILCGKLDLFLFPRLT